MNTISPDIACETCKVVARSPDFGNCMDLKCPECCVRHLVRQIAMFGAFGDDEHENRIKDRLFEELLKWREGE